jgi:hypothetical protein
VFTCILASSRITRSGSWKTDPSFLRWFCHRHHPLIFSLLRLSPRRACALGSPRWRRAAAADAAGDSSMLACVKSRAGSSSSTCATWAWPRHDCRHSLAQWPSLPQLRQASSRPGFWLPAAPPWARPRASAWAPPRASHGLPCLRPLVEEEDSLFFPSP